MSFKDELLTGEHRGPTATGMRLMLADSPTRAEYLATLHRQFLRDIEPLIRAKARVYSLFMPTIIIYPDGRIESDFQLPPDLQAYCDEVDRMIASVRAEYEKLVTRLLP